MISRYRQLDDRFIDLWNEWYAAACVGSEHQARSATLALRTFLKERWEGGALIRETVACIARRKIRIPHLQAFPDQVKSVFRSIDIYLSNPGMAPEPLSEFLSNMQSYMYQCL